jgi:hypothetical protein
MDDRPQQRSRAAHAARRRTLGEDLQRISECFEEDCALGVLVVDASGLAPSGAAVRRRRAAPRARQPRRHDQGTSPTGSP